MDVNTTTQTAKELRAETAPCLDAVTSLEVVVDGVPVPNLREKFRVKSGVFAVALPSDDLFGLDARTYSPAIDDGFYVMLRPLSAALHCAAGSVSEMFFGVLFSSSDRSKAARYSRTGRLIDGRSDQSASAPGTPR